MKKFGSSISKVLSCARLVKVFVLALLLLVVFGSNPVMAAVIPTQFPLKADVKNGSFSINATVNNVLNRNTTVRRAILILPDAEVGTIKSIKITGSTVTPPSTTNIFGCVNTNVRNGTDLIKACGGPAVLPATITADKLTYQAEGIGFNPNPNFKFEIVLFDDF